MNPQVKKNIKKKPYTKALIIKLSRGNDKEKILKRDKKN